MNAAIRNLWGEETPAEIIELDHGAIAVVVPVLGHLVFSAEAPDRPRAALSQGPDDGQTHPRHVKVIDSALRAVDARFYAWGEVARSYEIELLPNSSGEDRIVVVIRP